jgi:hypothetical protein
LGSMADSVTIASGSQSLICRDSSSETRNIFSRKLSGAPNVVFNKEIYIVNTTGWIHWKMIKLSKANSSTYTTCFNILKFCILLSHCIVCFYGSHNKQP